MRFYKFPKWLKRIYPNAIWDFFLTKDKSIYLTFDDGPNPLSTPWILELLNKHDAKASFFCLGKNTKENPYLFQKIQTEGHQIGNHTFNHLKGFKTNDKDYLEDVSLAAKYIPSKLFRPPYGKMKPSQYKKIRALGYTTVFWTHISFDFDHSMDNKLCLKKLKRAVKPGAIIVFHDSEKAFPQLKKILPPFLQYLKEVNYSCNIINI
jgi:peptidoglycan/xylan/chitin deacetylase (PgdA/CDA1 family)